MTRSIVSGLLGLLSVIVLGSLPVACQSGGVGDPCTPEDEYDPRFAGFKVTEENIESRSFQCETRICLVNHFQGRVSCPLGQEGPQTCSGLGDTSCPCVDPAADPASCTKKACVQSAIFAPECDPSKNKDCVGETCTNEDCDGRMCNEKGKYCECTEGAEGVVGCPLDGTWECPDDPDHPHQCTTYVCHDNSGNGCQKAGAVDNGSKDCCVPGTDVPIASPVCGQCAKDANNNDSTRSAEQAVYCSCRCGVAEGEEDDPDFNFCDCPDGYTCEEIRKDVGLGDTQITGKYCIKEGTKFTSDAQCGYVTGNADPTQCKGTKASQ